LQNRGVVFFIYKKFIFMSCRLFHINVVCRALFAQK
jgi:hypothetical protein